MADIGGVLGEATVLTVGTHTVYTCPAGKWAKVRIMWRALLQNNGTLAITVNGTVILGPNVSGGAETWYSSTAAMYEEMGTPTDVPTGDAAATTVAPGPVEYYLSGGDTITYTVGAQDLTACKVQVVGVELDAT